jgi:hypothetical protein
MSAQSAPASTRNDRVCIRLTLPMDNSLQTGTAFSNEQTLRFDSSKNRLICTSRDAFPSVGTRAAAFTDGCLKDQLLSKARVKPRRLPVARPDSRNQSAVRNDPHEVLEPKATPRLISSRLPPAPRLPRFRRQERRSHNLCRQSRIAVAVESVNLGSPGAPLLQQVLGRHFGRVKMTKSLLCAAHYATTSDYSRHRVGSHPVTGTSLSRRATPAPITPQYLRFAVCALSASSIGVNRKSSFPSFRIAPVAFPRRRGTFGAECPGSAYEPQTPGRRRIVTSWRPYRPTRFDGPPVAVSPS